MLVALLEAAFVEAALAGHLDKEFLVIDFEAEFFREPAGDTETARADLASDGDDQMGFHIMLLLLVLV